jgi:hypothetical protein
MPCARDHVEYSVAEKPTKTRQVSALNFIEEEVEAQLGSQRAWI